MTFNKTRGIQDSMLILQISPTKKHLTFSRVSLQICGLGELIDYFQHKLHKNLITSGKHSKIICKENFGYLKLNTFESTSRPLSLYIIIQLYS